MALMLLGAQWYILFNVIAGASAIPGELKEAGVLYHMETCADRWKKDLFSQRVSVSGDGSDHRGGRSLERDDRGRMR